jgi:hypothetical protein
LYYEEEETRIETAEIKIVKIVADYTRKGQTSVSTLWKNSILLI